MRASRQWNTAQEGFDKGEEFEKTQNGIHETSII